MLDESEQEEMDTFGIEMNSWVDTVLKVVYDNGQGRDIIFSSFHPDICLMLSLKQVCQCDSSRLQTADIFIAFHSRSLPDRWRIIRDGRHTSYKFTRSHPFCQ